MAAETVDLAFLVQERERAELFVQGSAMYSGSTQLERMASQAGLAIADPKAYGQRLFDASFGDGNLREGYRLAKTLAEERGHALRFQLMIHDSAPLHAHHLHWELGRAGEDHYCWGASPNLWFSRCPWLSKQPTEFRVEQPRLGVAVAAPTDVARYGLAHLDRRIVLDTFKKRLKRLAPRLALSVLDGRVTSDRLSEFCRDRGLHMLLLVAHGVQRASLATAEMVLEQRSGEALFVDQSRFGDLLDGCRSLRQVTLLTCSGAQITGTDPFSGIGPALVGRGIPTVIAMNSPISLNHALPFAQDFYQNLASNGCVDRAMAAARHKAYLQEPELPFWHAPLLYMRPRDGYIWRHADDDGRRKPDPMKRHSQEERPWHGGGVPGVLNALKGNRVEGAVIIENQTETGDKGHIVNDVDQNHVGSIKIANRIHRD